MKKEPLLLVGPVNFLLSFFLLYCTSFNVSTGNGWVYTQPCKRLLHYTVENIRLMYCDEHLYIFMYILIFKRKKGAIKKTLTESKMYPTTL